MSRCPPPADARLAEPRPSASLTPPTLPLHSRRATRPIIYWSTGRKAAEEAAAAGAAEPAAAGANGDANGAAAEEEEELSPEEQKRRARRGGLDLDAIVDLSGLDLSILQRPARMPPLARVRRAAAACGACLWAIGRARQRAAAPAALARTGRAAAWSCAPHAAR